jgi:glycerol-3-phosphate O-acyltransferase
MTILHGRLCYSASTVTVDAMTRAIMAREDVSRYLNDTAGSPDSDARQRIEEYLDELRTTQRYRFYRALQHPLYPILRKVRRIAEHAERATQALEQGHVVYVSNHKSHLDYLIQPLVLDDRGMRPPLLAAAINLFGGPMGLVHRHVTGAIPIRRNSKDALYLVTLRAYIAETLKERDLLYYAEGGRSYSGELKPFKTGLFQAALQANRQSLSVLPMAVAYDLVLEDRIVSRAALRKDRLVFGQELTEIVRHAVGYKSRAFVTFGQPIPLADYDPASRRDLISLSRAVRREIGRLYKVVPTALVAAAMRRGTSRSALVDRIGDLIARLTADGANLAVTSAEQAATEGLEALASREVLVPSGDRIRVRDRFVLRYYARTIQHLLRQGASH